MTTVYHHHTSPPHLPAHTTTTTRKKPKQNTAFAEVVTTPIHSDETKRQYQSSVTVKRCECCATIFKPARSTHKYCSRACRQNAYRLSKVDTSDIKGKYCVRCNERLTGRQRKYCGNTCKQLSYRAKKRATIRQYERFGIDYLTVLDSVEKLGITKSMKALKTLGYTYDDKRKVWSR